MLNKRHQGEKPYVDNLYYEDQFDENDSLVMDDGTNYYIVLKGMWKKLHPYGPSVDKNNIAHTRGNPNPIDSDTNTYDDRNLSWKEIQFRI